MRGLAKGPERQDREGGTGDLRIINALLERGARLNDLILDDTALDAAEANDRQPAARVLHARGGRRARKPFIGRGD